MRKRERDKCDRLIEEAVRNISYAQAKWNRYEKCKKEGNAVEAEIALRNFEYHIGYAEGIKQSLECIGYLAGKLKELNELNVKEDPKIKWTNGDSQCIFRELPMECFGYAEVRQNMSEKYVFCVKTLNIKNYSDEEIKNIVATQYSGGVNEVMEIYKEEASQIIAECIFESLPLEDMDYISDPFDNKDIAASKMYSYVIDQVNIWKHTKKKKVRLLLNIFFDRCLWKIWTI